MNRQNLNDLAEEILELYAEWIEAGLIDVDQLLLTLLLRERDKVKDLEKRLEYAAKY